LTGSELAPGVQRVAETPKLQGASKIIATATGDDKHGQLEFNQLCQMPVHRAVAAEEQNRVGFTRAGGQPQLPVGI
jgi:hypothetical protein